MVKKSGLAGQFYVDGHDLSGDVSALNNIGSPVAVLDVTALDKTAIERIRGLVDSNMEIAVWWDDFLNLTHDAFKGLPTADVITLYAQGGAVGDVAAALVGKQINYDWNRGADGSLAGTVQVQGSAALPLEWGNLLSAGKITHASATSSASKDDAASTAAGAAFVLELVSLATGTVTVTVEDSADNAAWLTIATFTAAAAAAAPQAQRVEVSGTIRRYLRITTTGTFTNAIFALAYRRGTAQDTEAY